MYFRPPHASLAPSTAAMATIMGLMGSLIDSILGAHAQATVVDRKTGRVVEGPGGIRVKVGAGGSRTQRGYNLLTNNGVNFCMAALTSLLTMGVGHALGMEVFSR